MSTKYQEFSLLKLDSLDSVLRGVFLYSALLTSMNDNIIPRRVKKVLHAALTALSALQDEEDDDAERGYGEYAPEHRLFMEENPMSEDEFETYSEVLIDSKDLIKLLLKSEKLIGLDQVILSRAYTILQQVDDTCVNDYVLGKPSVSD